MSVYVRCLPVTCLSASLSVVLAAAIAVDEINADESLVPGRTLELVHMDSAG